MTKEEKQRELTSKIHMFRTELLRHREKLLDMLEQGHENCGIRASELDFVIRLYETYFENEIYGAKKEKTK